MKAKHIEIKPLTWIAQEFGVASKCDLDIYAADDGCLILVADRPDNKDLGLSCTEGPGSISQVLYRWYGYEPEGMIWLEYDPEKDAYSRVLLECDQHCVKDWSRTPCPHDEATALLTAYQK